MLSVAVLPVPLTWPADALYEYVSGRFCGLTPWAVTVAVAARLNGRRIGRAAKGRRIVLLDSEVRRAIREHANLLPFGNVAGNGVVTRRRDRWCQRRPWCYRR